MMQVFLGEICAWLIPDGGCSSSKSSTRSLRAGRNNAVMLFTTVISGFIISSSCARTNCRVITTRLGNSYCLT